MRITKLVEFVKVESFADDNKYLDYIKYNKTPYYYIDDGKINGFVQMRKYKIISYNDIILYLQTIKKYCYYFSNIVTVTQELFIKINELKKILVLNHIKCEDILLVQINLVSLLLDGECGKSYIRYLNGIVCKLYQHINQIKEKIKLT